MANLIVNRANVIVNIANVIVNRTFKLSMGNLNCE